MSYAFRHRSQARMLALQALCVFEALGDGFSTQLNDFLRDPQTLVELELPDPPPGELLEFARSLATQAWARRGEFDGWLRSASERWSVERMTPVDRNVLRIGLAELFGDPPTPPRVALDEAIELARRFGALDSPSFVNGILDALWKQHGDGTAGAALPQASNDPQPA